MASGAFNGVSKKLSYMLLASAMTFLPGAFNDSAEAQQVRASQSAPASGKSLEQLREESAKQSKEARDVINEGKKVLQDLKDLPKYEAKKLEEAARAKAEADTAKLDLAIKEKDNFVASLKKNDKLLLEESKSNGGIYIISYPHPEVLHPLSKSKNPAENYYSPNAVAESLRDIALQLGAPKADVRAGEKSPIIIMKGADGKSFAVKAAIAIVVDGEFFKFQDGPQAKERLMKISNEKGYVPLRQPGIVDNNRGPSYARAGREEFLPFVQ